MSQSDDVFRQTNRKMNQEDRQPAFSEEVGDPLAGVRSLQNAMAHEVDGEEPMPHANPMANPDKGFAISGQMPEALRRAMEQKADPSQKNTPEERSNKSRLKIADKGQVTGSDQLESLLIPSSLL